MRLRYILLIILLFTISVSCNNKHDEKKTLTIGLDNPPQNLDPRKGSDFSSQKIHQLIYNSLFKKDINGNLIYDLLKEHKFINKKEIYFKIKKNIYFHNNKELTSKDIKYTFLSLLSPDFISFRKNTLSVIKSIKIINKYEFVFKLKRAFSPIFEYLIMGIIPEKLKNPETNPIGSGPYKFISYKKGILKLKPFYKNKENKNNFDILKIKIIRDPITRVLELKNSDIDLSVNDIPIDSIKDLKSRNHLEIFNEQGSRYHYIAFNFKNKYLKNIDIRKAIRYSINRDKIIKYLYRGYARKAESLLPPKNEYHLNLPSIDLDLQKAKSLMLKNGFNINKRFRLEFKCSNSGDGKNLGLILKNELKKIFIDLNVIVRDFSSFYSDIKSGNFQLYSLAWTGIYDPDIYYFIFNSKNFPPKGANRGFYKNSEIDKLTELGREIYNKEKRKEIYNKVQEIIYEEIPYISLWYSDNIAVVNKRINNFRLFSVGEYYFFKDISLKK